MDNLPNWANDMSNDTGPSMPKWAQDESKSSSVISPAAAKAITQPVSKTIQDQLYIRGQAAYTGALSFAATLAKGLSKMAYESDHPVDKMIQKVIPSPETIQSYYDKQAGEYRENVKKDIMPYSPFSVGMANIAGGLLPAALIPGATTSGALKGAEAGGKLLSGMPTVGKLLGSVAGGAAEGALWGSLYTREGQDPNEILNTQGAKSGAIFGGTAGPVIKYMDSYFNRATEYERYAKSANITFEGITTPYTGHTFNRDLSGTYIGDTIGNFRRASGNAILDNVIGGTGAARDANKLYLQKSAYDFINNLSQKTINQSEQTLQNNLYNTIKGLTRQDHANWNEIYKTVKSNGIKITNLDNYNEQFGKLANFIDELPESMKANISLPAQATKAYSEIYDIPVSYKSSQGNVGSKLLPPAQGVRTKFQPPENPTFETVHKLKRDVWTQYEKLSKLSSPSTQQMALMDTLKDMYFGLNDDIRNSIVSAGDNNLLAKFESANEFTKATKQLFDPKTNRQLVAAVKDMNTSQKGLYSYMKWVESNNYSKRQSMEIGGILNDNKNDRRNIILKQLYENSLEPHFNPSAPGSGQIMNLEKFVVNAEEVLNSPNKDLIAGDAIKAMQGLLTHMKNASVANTERQAGLTGSSLLQGATSVGYGGGAFKMLSGDPLTGAAIMTATYATPKALGAISLNSPLKKTLIFFNDKIAPTLTGNADNTGVAQYVMQQINKQLIKAGIIVNNREDGTKTLDVKEQTKQFMRDITPSVPRPEMPKGGQPTGGIRN